MNCSWSGLLLYPSVSLDSFSSSSDTCYFWSFSSKRDHFSKMRLMLLTNVVTFIYTAGLATCHPLTEHFRLPPLKILGGRKALVDLQLLRRQAQFSPSSIRTEKRTWSDPDINNHKQCGPGVGSCDFGDW